MKRKRYTAEIKSQIVLEILMEEKTMSQIHMMDNCLLSAHEKPLRNKYNENGVI